MAFVQIVINEIFFIKPYPHLGKSIVHHWSLNVLLFRYQWWSHGQIDFLEIERPALHEIEM